MRQIITDDSDVILTTIVSDVRQEGAILIADDATWAEIVGNIGRRRWVDGALTAYEPPAPSIEEIRVAMPSLSPRQLWLVASRIGITKNQVLALVDDMEDQAAAADLRIEINEATSYHRIHSAVVELAELLEIPTGQFDDLWLWAATF